MAGKGDGRGEGTAKLDGQIACIKYTLFCFNIMSWVGGRCQGSSESVVLNDVMAIVKEKSSLK